MSIYEFAQSGIVALTPTTFSAENDAQIQDLQRLLRENVAVICPDTMVIAEDFAAHDDATGKIDLLGLDRAANLVVIALARTDDSGLMELHAIRHAATVAHMTFDRAAEAFAQFLASRGNAGQDPGARILEFLGWDAPPRDQFAANVRIVLAAPAFSREFTASVLWLIDRGVEIRCVRMKPYAFDARVLLDVQQIIPLPETAGIEVKARAKTRNASAPRAAATDAARYDIQFDDEHLFSLTKKNAIFQICRRLCAHAVSPEEIADHFPWRANPLWHCLDGTLTAAEFAERALEQAASNGTHYDPNRWFRKQGELIQANNRTYAFSNQWGGRWHLAMTTLKAAYPQHNIDFAPAD